MEPLNIFEKYKTEFLNNFNSEYLEIKYINDEKPIYLIIYDDIIELNYIIKKLPKEWEELSTNKIIKISIVPHPLTIFNKHADILDDFYEDSLIIKYHNFGKPTFDIQYDENDPHEIRKNLPEDWKFYEKCKIIDIVIRNINEAEDHPTDNNPVDSTPINWNNIIYSNLKKKEIDLNNCRGNEKKALLAAKIFSGEIDADKIIKEKLGSKI